MSTSTSEIRDREDQFVYELRAVYDMELKLVDALTEMSETATNENLVKGFALHANETETQVQRVEAAFETLGTEPSRRESPITDALLAETAQFESVAADDHLLNRHYFDAAVTTERVEISEYEALLRMAEAANLGDAVREPLADNLAEEKKTLRKLEGLGGGLDVGAVWKALTGS